MVGTQYLVRIETHEAVGVRTGEQVLAVDEDCGNRDSDLSNFEMVTLDPDLKPVLLGTHDGSLWDGRGRIIPTKWATRKTATIRTVSGESNRKEHVDDDSLAYLAHLEAGWRKRRICSLRSDIAGLPHRFRAGHLTIGDTQMVWQASLSLRRRKIVLPPLDSVLAIRPWGGPGEGRFNYRRKVAVTSGPSGVVELALGGVGAELVRRFVQPNAPRATADPDGPHE